MEKYVVPVAPIDEKPKPISRSNWKRCLTELNGKSRWNCIKDDYQLLMISYSQIGEFPHKYSIAREICHTHFSHYYTISDMDPRHPGSATSYNYWGVADVKFDTKGIYLASASRAGCLTVHEFESLYCQTSGKEDEGKQLLHITLSNGISAVCWNPANQDEVLCTSLSSNEVNIFDIGYISSEPTEILEKRPAISVHTSNVRKGLSDIAVFDDNARVLASDIGGTISIWDRRVSNLPQSDLTNSTNSGITSIQLFGDQCVYGASKNGFIHVWDLRGGRASTAFQSHKQSYPITSVKLATLMSRIGPLKAQSNILPKEIESININPSCPYQLGFHLEDGWSGVLDLHNFQVSHIHCPPPAWLSTTKSDSPVFPPRKSTWLPQYSIYANGSTTTHGLHLLDFYPNTSSPCHVDYDDSNFKGKENKFVPLSERATACAIHPLNGSIVVGTLKASLLMISQKQRSSKEEEDDDHDDDYDYVRETVASFEYKMMMSLFD